MFDKYKAKLSKIEDFEELERFIDSIDLDGQFVKYASQVDKIVPAEGEWEESKEYMMPTIKGLVGRYSKVGEAAFYRFSLPLDNTIQAAVSRRNDSL